MMQRLKDPLGKVLDVPPPLSFSLCRSFSLALGCPPRNGFYSILKLLSRGLVLSRTVVCVMQVS